MHSFDQQVGADQYSLAAVRVDDRSIIAYAFGRSGIAEFETTGEAIDQGEFAEIVYGGSLYI
jgi:hypothetical protein